MEPQSMKIALTGATGFTGIYLLKLLVNKGYRVKALRRKEAQLPLDNSILKMVEWIEGDILDLTSVDRLLEGCTHVIHNAAFISFDPRQRKRLDKVNTQGTANMVNAALHHSIVRFIHISSVAALGDGLDGISMTENEQWRFNKKHTPHYNLSKFAAECEVWRGFAEGLNGVILNPGVILGSGPWSGGSAGIIPKMLKYRQYYPTGGTGIVDVRDVANVIKQMLSVVSNHERYILTGHNLHYKQLAKLVDEASGNDFSRHPLPSWLGEIVWRVNEFVAVLSGSSPLASRFSIRASAKMKTFDNSKLRNLLRYNFIPVEETVVETVRDYKSLVEGKINESRMLGEFAV
jgi:dihydroflavonol-4-reductase